jgi:hypothetical protein
MTGFPEMWLQKDLIAKQRSLNVIFVVLHPVFYSVFYYKPLLLRLF